MISACSVCLLMKYQVTPTKDDQVSHGLCREHELASLAVAGIAHADELSELAQLRAEHVVITVRVHPQVASRLAQLRVELEGACAAPPDLAGIAGLAIARDLNRGEYDKTPIQTYRVAGPGPGPGPGGDRS